MPPGVLKPKSLMDDIGRSRTPHDPLVLAPKDYFLGPVFAATKQTGSRIVTVGEKRYEIGGFHPLRRNLFPPALDVRHARAIFTMLSFRKPYDDDGTRLIRFSLNDFCRKYARSNGGRYSRDIQHILGDLIDSYIRVSDVKSGIAHTYRLIEDLDIEERPIRRRDAKLANDLQSEMWFNGCILSTEFYGLLNRIAELQEIDLDVFTAIRSPLAQAIYLYIPSRAYHHSEAKPFEISLTLLLQQISFQVPFQRNRRRQIFTQHEDEGRSIMQQLDGVETLTGIFRVRLAETKDGKEYKLLAWVEKREKQIGEGKADSKIVSAYLKSGRPRELLLQSLANINSLTDYELDLLTEAKVEFPKNRRFFEVAKALLREPKFDGLLAEAKNDEKEGRKATKSQTHRLKRYYSVLPFLESHKLIIVSKEGGAFVFSLTEAGKLAAKKLEKRPEFAKQTTQMHEVKKLFGAWKGGTLKDLVYEVFDEEVGQKQLGEVIK